MSELNEAQIELEKDIESLLGMLFNYRVETPTQKPDTVEGKKGFSKFDKGKPRVSLVDPMFLLGIAEVMTQGAEVHGADNWKLCEEPERYLDALLRHTIKYWSGEKIDKDSGKSHLYHIGFNAMALDYLDNKLKD